MKELMLMFASIMEFDEMIDKLEKDIQSYKINPTEEGKKMIHLDCSLILSKEAVDANGSGIEGVEKMIRKINNVERLEKVFSPDKN